MRSAWFALAFGMLGANYIALAFVHPSEEARPWLYVLRLIGFVLILVAILGKNRNGDD